MSQIYSSGAAGSASGDATAEEVIAKSGLPSDVQAVISATVRASRLWVRERANVARELVAHFRDGLERGETAADLVGRFGEPKAAGKRIGKAAREKRTWLWHAQKRVLQGAAIVVGGVVLLYGAMWVRFATGSPTISRNFAAELNAPVLATPESERAWTVYRQAVMDIQPVYRAHEGWDNIETPAPGSPEFAKAKEAINAFAPHLARIRAATEMPNFGYVLSDSFDRELYRATHPGAQIADLPPPTENPRLLDVLLEPMQHMRRATRALALESRLAVAQGDGQRATDNIVAMLGMARHTFDMPFLIGELVGIAIARVAWATADDLIERYPEAFTDVQLALLAERIGQDSGPQEFFADPKSEAEFMDDTLQRMFTDDGNGDGRLTPDGMWYLVAISDVAARNTRLLPTTPLAGPAIMAYSAGRKETRERYHAVLDHYAGYRNKPMWTWTQNPDEHALEIIDDSGMVFPVVKVLAPALGNTVIAGNWTRQHREVTLAAIALEQYKRANGSYPATLAELVPTYLQSLPTDIADGQPIRYRVVDGKPLIYSIGMDRMDNDGRPAMKDGKPVETQTWLDPQSAAQLVAQGFTTTRFEDPKQYDGDVVLWPRGE